MHATRTVKVWNQESRERLQDCLDNTDWDSFFNGCDDPHELTDTITEYVKWCESNCVDSKDVKVYPNNKPWVTKELKLCLNRKNHAFLKGDMIEYREQQKELRFNDEEGKIRIQKQSGKKAL